MTALVVIAKSKAAAVQWAKDQGFNPRPSYANGWIYPPSRDSLYGLKDAKVVFTETATSHRQYSQIREFVTHGVSMGCFSELDLPLTKESNI